MSTWPGLGDSASLPQVIFIVFSAFCDLHLWFRVAENLSAEMLTHLVMLNEVDKRGPLHLHGLAVPVIERQDKVEKVGLAEVRGRLLLKMGPGQSDPTEDAERTRQSASSSNTSHSDNKIS